LHVRGLPGRPDIAFPRAKVAIFVHGCFWHGCPEHCNMPKSNAGFWAEKFQRNRARDERKTQELNAAGWRVLVLWEHDVVRAPQRCLQQVSRMLATRGRK
jgi:DNA mismatch endonuclease (patch repair protein)